MEQQLCQRCNSSRIMGLSCETNREKFSLSIKELSYEGSIPRELDMGEVTILNQNICLDCGQLQGKFPKEKMEANPKWRNIIKDPSSSSSSDEEPKRLNVTVFNAELRLYKEENNLIIQVLPDNSLFVIGIIEDGKLVEVPENKMYLLKQLKLQITPDALEVRNKYILSKASS